MSNIVIVGSGPAGVSALYAPVRAGVDTTVDQRPRCAGPGREDRKLLRPCSAGFRRRTPFFYRGKDVAVLGSGEYALHEVQALLPVVRSVTLLTNGAPLTADFPPEVTVYPQAVEAVLGETVVTGVQLSGGVQLPVSGVFVALGVAGSTALARKIGAEVDGNRIVVDEKMQTTVPGLYAAGDCTGGPSAGGKGCV